MAGHTYIDDFKTLPEMLTHTLATKPEKEGYRYFDYEHEKWTSVTWREFGERVMRWRKALAAMGFKRGDRVAMLLINSLDALTFDQAALANALVPVPLHAIDTPESAAYIMSDSGCRFLVTTTKARWNAIFHSDTPVPTLEQVVFTNEEEEGHRRSEVPFRRRSRLGDRRCSRGRRPDGRPDFADGSTSSPHRFHEW